jgi:hypothetical protein
MLVGRGNLRTGDHEVEIGFADETIPEAARAELADVLRGIAVEPPGHTGDAAGRWVTPVARITVLRRIPGGRSGADVLDVELERTGTDRRVIKIDTSAEWAAFRKHLAPRSSTLITPVEAVSRRVLDGAAEQTPVPDRAAIVYYHAADYASGTPTCFPGNLARWQTSTRSNSHPMRRWSCPTGSTR